MIRIIHILLIKTIDTNICYVALSTVFSNDFHNTQDFFSKHVLLHTLLPEESYLLEVNG